MLLVDRALGAAAAQALARTAREPVARRVVLVTPEQRSELPSLQEAGFSDYLVKPIRAASLAARFGPQEQDFTASAPLVPHEAERGPPEGDAKTLSILVAEDNEINALLARSLLAKLGHRPTLVANGAAAQCVRGRPRDLPRGRHGRHPDEAARPGPARAGARVGVALGLRCGVIAAHGSSPRKHG
jgi:CheY-like chemotaxis protein